MGVSKDSKLCGDVFPSQGTWPKIMDGSPGPGVLLDVSDNRSPEQEIGENHCVWIFAGQRYNHPRAGG